MKYLVKKDGYYLYKIKSNGFGYFSEKVRAKLFTKKEAEELAKKYKGEIEVELLWVD